MKFTKWAIIRTVDEKEMSALQKIRIDKWLWAARFFKSRTLAAEAVNGGKVHINGQRVKSSRLVHVGDQLEITRGQYRATITVSGLGVRRGPAKEAQKLYQETEESVTRRALSLQQRGLHYAGTPQSSGRPDKRQRRQLREASGKS